jgi:serine/threonine protein kinase
MSHSIQTECPSCRQVLLLAPDHVGALVKCPKCQTAFAALKFQSVTNVGSSMLTAIPLADEGGDSIETSSRETFDVASDSAGTTATGAGGQKKIGRYELKKLLGQGGFGKVYLAFDPDLERDIALKVLTLGSGQKNRIQRFLIEAKAAARLKHPNIVPTYVSGQADGKYFIASEFIEGELLSKQLKRQAFSPVQSARIVLKLARALSYAHDNDVVHRDVKPHNILIDQRGEPHLMDFGLAKRVDDDSKVTSDGSVLGTPAYMSPEQARGEVSSVGPSSDQYSLAVVLFQMLTGTTPFQGPPHLVIADVAKGKVPSVNSLRSDVSRDLAAVCDRALRSEPEDRYVSCEAFAADLENWLGNRPVTARPLTTYQEICRYLAQHKVMASFTAAIITLLLLTMISLGVIWKRGKQRALAEEANRLVRVEAGKDSVSQDDSGTKIEPLKTLSAENAETNPVESEAPPGEPLKGQAPSTKPLTDPSDSPANLSSVPAASPATSVASSSGSPSPHPAAVASSVAATLAQRLANVGGRVHSFYDGQRNQYVLSISIGIQNQGRLKSKKMATGSEAAIDAIVAADMPVNLSLMGQAADYSEKAIARITDITKMAKLSIAPEHNAVNDDFCQRLSKLQNLADITLSGPEITDAGLSSLSSLSTLKNLHLTRAALSNNGIRILENHGTLEWLHLSGCRRLRDPATATFEKMPRLTRLILDDTGISADAVTRLRMARPALHVGMTGRTPWLARDAHQADFNANSASGLRASDVWIRYDAEKKELQCSVLWSLSDGMMYYVRSRLTDEELEKQKAIRESEGYTVSRIRSASVGNEKYHIVLWTKNPNQPSVQTPPVSSTPAQE